MDTSQLKAYYLGGLTREQEAQLEGRCFEDDNAFAELMSVQANLVDAYIRNQMPPEEREAFRRQYLSTPGGRNKVRLAQILTEAVAGLDRDTSAPFSSASPSGVAERWWTRWVSPLTSTALPSWAGAARVVLVAILLLLLVDDGRLRLRVENLSSRYVAATEREQRTGQALEAERARADRLDERLQEVQSRNPSVFGPLLTTAGTVVALSLTPGITRANETLPELVIPRRTSFVLLELALDSPERLGLYRIVIETVDGREVWRQDATGDPSAKADAALVIGVGASTFDTGDYLVRLERRRSPGTVETVHTYQFRVAGNATRPR